MPQCNLHVFVRRTGEVLWETSATGWPTVIYRDTSPRGFFVASADSCRQLPLTGLGEATFLASGPWDQLWPAMTRNTESVRPGVRRLLALPVPPTADDVLRGMMRLRGLLDEQLARCGHAS